MSAEILATANALYTTGCWLLERQRHDDAKHVFRTMLLVAPNDERGWLGLGSCHEETGETERADALYELAPQACGPAARCAVARARLLRLAGRFDDADAAYALAADHAESADDHEILAVIIAERDLS